MFLKISQRIQLSMIKDIQKSRYDERQRISEKGGKALDKWEESVAPK